MIGFHACGVRSRTARFFFSMVTTRKEEAQRQMKEVTAPREKLNVWKMELQLAEQCMDEVERNGTIIF